MALQHKENQVTKSRHLDITKMTRSSKIYMSAEIMSMSRDIKLKENFTSGGKKLGVRKNRLTFLLGNI